MRGDEKQDYTTGIVEQSAMRPLRPSVYETSVWNTRMDKVVNYILNRRDTAETYLEDGRCSFTVYFATKSTQKINRIFLRLIFCVLLRILISNKIGKGE